MAATTTLLLLSSALGAGMMAGLYFVFSVCVMSALDRLPPAAAIDAMKMVNTTILHPLFFFAFFGTGIVGLALVPLSFSQISFASFLCVAIGVVAYWVGSIGITMICNVPLNRRLASLPGGVNVSITDWIGYRQPWTRWNHLRPVLCLVSSTAFSLALRL